MTDWTNITIFIVGILCFLIVLVTIILTMIGTFKMHEAIVRGKAMREKCGTEYYETETIRYQVYEKWEQDVKKIFNTSAWLTIFVILTVLLIYLVIININTFSKLIPSGQIVMISTSVILFILYAIIGTFLLLPESGVKLYGEMDESGLTKRIIGSVVMIVAIMIAPLIIFSITKFRNSKNEYNGVSSIFSEQFAFYKGGWILIGIVLIFAFLNLIYALMIKDGIHQNYYNPMEPNQLTTGEINEVIKKAIDNVKSGKAPVSSTDYALYKKIYQGINEVDAPANGVDEGSLKDPTSTNYQPYFKYLKHSSDVDKVLDQLSSDIKSKFKSLENVDEKVSKPIKRVFNITLSMIIIITAIPFYLFFHTNYQKPGFLLKIGGTVLFLMLFSFLYVMMSQSLIS